MSLLLLLFISSCTLIFGTDQPAASAKGRHYTVHFDAAGWSKKNDERSDYIFSNDQDGRILLSNSFCDEFQEGSLEQMARRTFSHLSDFEAISQEYTQFNQREAYRLLGTGKVDGVKVNLQLLNTRRNNCYFDFVAIDPFKPASSHQPDFERFLQAVEFR